MHFNSVSNEVDDPIFGNRSCGVERKLANTIVDEGAVRYFNYKDHVVRPRGGVPVAFSGEAGQDKIRFRFRVARQPKRVLHSDPGSARELLNESTHQGVDAKGMATPGGWHLDDLSLDKLHAVVFAEN